MAFYSDVPIQECGEPLVKIPNIFVLTQPHPYVRLNAPYGNLSPYYLRSGVLQKLELAQQQLQDHCPQWRFKIFDAFRPVAVQQFMVDYTKHQLAPYFKDEAELMARVYQFWAVPSSDRATPPPHSTGAAVDLTLIDDNNQEVEMGGAIDDVADYSEPNYFENKPDCLKYHRHRQILKNSMLAAGFQQHPKEWWHFSYGDQMWSWLGGCQIPACYGGVAQFNNG